MMTPAAPAFPCPFCGAPAISPRCQQCQRDPQAPRRICGHCAKQTPSSEKACMHCQTAAGSDLSWKIPLIVVLFLLALAVSIAVHSA
ncbi:MAG TPA: hypothetical protein VNO30_06485 [Kofleriaceae bacterium]|nr:hypothetical protein [Kofleriaceae bacterium]